MLLILFAEKQESESFLSHVEIINEYIFDNSFSSYQNILLCKYKNKKFYVAHMGVGKVNSSLFLSRLLNIKDFKISEILNIGASGGLKKTKVGEAFLVQKSYYYDVDLTCLKNYKLGQLPNNVIEFKTNDNLNLKFQKILNLELTNNVSADKFFTISDAKNIEKNFNNIKTMDMEATALIHTADFYNMPISIIKVISDNITIEDNDKDYRNNTLIVSARINDLLLNILERLN
ncbi:5'-methylthioadenosine nucleosidase [Metamycoplasma phocicerebrale]|uniref:5'-methylthioadenosine nucleosidase n=1 Tax=Metamycoplasma phocicerebrale TaxID=142649 RepID=A0A3T0TTG4_9BACT|nr:5'-methylthioadenosine/S-adenosylhomocysteine nucleosidase [Metamycoplasma phocicerebrale]AZZ65377.1 5'-methylthioadenosine nucleosidase [Metamycoplasma phocicerebrale]